MTETSPREGLTGQDTHGDAHSVTSSKTSSSSLRSGESGVFCNWVEEDGRTGKRKTGSSSNVVRANKKQTKVKKLRRQTATINVEEVRSCGKIIETRPDIILEGEGEVRDDSLLEPPSLLSSTPMKNEDRSHRSVPDLKPPVLTPVSLAKNHCQTLNRHPKRSGVSKIKKSLNTSFASNTSVSSSSSKTSLFDKSTSWIINACDSVLSPRRKRKEGKTSKNASVLLDAAAAATMTRASTSAGAGKVAADPLVSLAADGEIVIPPRSNSLSGSDRLSKTSFTSDGKRCGKEAADATLCTLKLEYLGRTFPGPDNSCVTPCSSARATEPHPNAYFTIDSRKLASKHSRRTLVDKKLLQCVKQFNLDPNTGVEMLRQNGIVDTTKPEEIANFLFREGRLSKKQIGAYIGSHNPLNFQVLKCFVRKHEFMNLILVQALRQFLWSFRLPGEAMQIDRIMESFAEHYCAQNPELFEETDTCYIISFSIIMLNTALHNPNVRTKITPDQFVAQNRGINSGKDLPVDILEQIYRSIKEEPFRIPDENYDDLMYTFFSPEKEGWLLKEGGSWKSWKRRWFVLSDRCLYYFQHTTENAPKGIVPLENVKIRTIPDEDGKCFCFEVFCVNHGHVKGCKTDSHGTVVQGNHRSYKLSASCDEERTAWVQAIQDSIKDHPFYDIISSKKAALRRKSLKHGSQHDIPQSSTI